MQPDDKRAIAEAWADRLDKLLDVALDAIRRGDGATAVMALKEGVDSAPKRDDPDPIQGSKP